MQPLPWKPRSPMTHSNMNCTLRSESRHRSQHGGTFESKAKAQKRTPGAGAAEAIA
jgi:hypothetical protein